MLSVLAEVLSTRYERDLTARDRFVDEFELGAPPLCGDSGTNVGATA